MTHKDAPEDSADSIVIDCHLDEPPEKVWKALTDSYLLAEWLGPNDVQPEVGRRFIIRLGDGLDEEVACEVLNVEANRSISYTWRSGGRGGQGGAPSVDTIVTWTLIPTFDGGTRLRLVHQEVALSGVVMAIGRWLPVRARARRFPVRTIQPLRLAA